MRVYVRAMTNFSLRGLLVAIAVLGLMTAWWRYPAENHFAILSCTISFLGSPDADRNPTGWRYYQAGMTALVLLLFSLAWERHRRLWARIGRTARWSSSALFLALALILLSVWIADTRHVRWWGIRTGALHTRMAILAIPILGTGILLDAVALWRSGVPSRALWPFHFYGLIVLVGTAELILWERMCQRDPALPHWPGEGLHSTPLWEWIAFTYLIVFMVWLAHGRLPAANRK